MKRLFLFLVIISGTTSISAQTSQYSTPRTYGTYSSPYNLELIQQVAIYKQQLANQNLKQINSKFEEILDFILEDKEDLTKEQWNYVIKFEKELDNLCQCDLSNNSNFRIIMQWMDKKKRYFSSWKK